MTLPSEQEMRTAIAKRDKTFDGRFVYGVLTTGVFCLPSCSARPARPENLRFFATSESAVSDGYRACRRCQPVIDRTRSEQLVELARYIETHADQRLTLATLAERSGVSASQLQRRFKAHFGVSPKAYQDAARMRLYKGALQQGDGVTEAILSAGFGSISRVYGQTSRHIGMAPKAYRAGGSGETIAYACRDTLLGPMLMAAAEKGVCFVQFGDSNDALLTNLHSEFPNAEISASPGQHSAELNAWIDALNQHISRDAPCPELPLDLRGTAFQIKVWNFLLSIPEGQRLSYSELAEQIEQPKAIRAVASACAANRIGILIPCHRVLRADGSLGGYRWGLTRKQALLDAERARSSGSKPQSAR